MGGGRPAWAAPRRLGHARRPPGPTGGSGGSSFEINPVVCPVRRPASAHGTLRWCSWRAAVRAYPPPLAQPQPALTHDSLVGADLQMEVSRWTIDPDQRTGVPFWQVVAEQLACVLFPLRCQRGSLCSTACLTLACLPLVAKMGMHRWVCYGPEPRSASLGLPFDCTFSPTLSLGHPAMCLLLTAHRAP